MLTYTVFSPVLLLDWKKQKDPPALQAKTEYSECLLSRPKGELDRFKIFIYHIQIIHNKQEYFMYGALKVIQNRLND